MLCFLFTFPGNEGLPVLADQTASQMSHSAMMQRGNGHSPEKMDFVVLRNKRKRHSPAVVEHNVVCFTKQDFLRPVSVLFGISFFFHCCMV